MKQFDRYAFLREPILGAASCYEAAEITEEQWRALQPDPKQARLLQAPVTITCPWDDWKSSRDVSDS